MFPLFQVRPHLELTFENILSHINTVYVLKTKPGVMEAEHQDVAQEFSYLRLKVSWPTFHEHYLLSEQKQTKSRKPQNVCLVLVTRTNSPNTMSLFLYYHHRQSINKQRILYL
jgi:hypothetical protein